MLPQWGKLLRETASTRRVYIFEKAVLKVPQWKDHFEGIQQNRAEGRAWFKLLSDHPQRDRFAPVIACHPEGQWLLQERVEGKSVYESVLGAKEGDMARLYHLCVELGIHDVCSANSIKTPSGKFVLVDYGVNNLK